MQKQVKIHLTTEMNRKVKEQSTKRKATVMVLSVHWLTSASYLLVFLPCSDFFHSTLISHASHFSTLHSSLNFFHMCCLNIYHDASSCLLPIQLSEHAQNMQSFSLCSDIDDLLDPVSGALGLRGAVGSWISFGQPIFGLLGPLASDWITTPEFTRSHGLLGLGWPARNNQGRRSLAPSNHELRSLGNPLNCQSNPGSQSSIMQRTEKYLGRLGR